MYIKKKNIYIYIYMYMYVCIYPMIENEVSFFKIVMNV
jgi:hypothetical protein